MNYRLIVMMMIPCVAFCGKLEKPNILVVITDEHHAGVMGCAGDKLARTPNLDALAAQGVIFDAQYCASPICIPSRQSLTIGKYVSHHNVWGNTAAQAPESWPTLPKIMTAAGYDPCLVGKMHYKGGQTYGFNILDKASKTKGAKEEKASAAPKPRARQRLPAGVFQDQGDKLGEEFTPIGEATDMDSFVDVKRREDAVKFFRERKADAKPFFLVVGLIAPHYPMVAPPEYLAHFKDKIPPPEIPQGYLESLPLNYKHLRNDRKLERVPPETVKLAREAYYARVEWTDHQIGEVLKALKASPFASDTIVIYTSDHGENLGEHGLWWKNCMFDCAARVPLIVSWPKRWKGGQRRSGACGSVDLVQTIAALAGAQTPKDWDGESFLPWLDDPSFAWRDLAVSEFYSGYIASGMVMIRQGDWKLVYHTRADEKHGPEQELYNLKTDPQELRNLAADPKEEGRMKRMFEALVKELKENPEESEKRYRAGAIPECAKGAVAL